MRSPRRLALLGSLVLLAGCGDSSKTPDAPPRSPPVERTVPKAGAEPEHIAVDHILIGVRSGAFPQGKRSQDDARKVAEDLLAKLKAGGDWDAAKREFSEDPPPGGPYGMANEGFRPEYGERPRKGMVDAFGDVGFRLAVGEIGLAAFDATKSPFGYHVIKRIR